MEKYYKGSTLVLSSVQNPSKSSRASGNVLKNLLSSAKNTKTPTNLHYEDPLKVLERDNNKYCTLEWKTCKACHLKISVGELFRMANQPEEMPAEPTPEMGMIERARKNSPIGGEARMRQIDEQIRRSGG